MEFYWQDVIAIGAAAALGAVVGFERQLHRKSAGLRTNMLVCVGAATFTLVAQHMVGSLEAPGRMVAAIVTGIGFLGAGALIRDTSGVHGLTTAASIWLVASVGVACGMGFYALAIMATVVAFAVLWLLAPAEKKLFCLDEDAGSDSE